MAAGSPRASRRRSRSPAFVEGDGGGARARGRVDRAVGQSWSALGSSGSESRASDSTSSGVGEEEVPRPHRSPPRRRRIIQNCSSGRVQACVEVRQSRARWARDPRPAAARPPASAPPTPSAPSAPLVPLGTAARERGRGRCGGVVTAAAAGSPTVVVDGGDALRRRDRDGRSPSESDEGDILIKIRSPLVSGLGTVTPGGAATADSIIGIRLRNFDRRRGKRHQSPRAALDGAWRSTRAIVSRAGLGTAHAVGSCGRLLARGSRGALRAAKRFSSSARLRRRPRAHAVLLLALAAFFFLALVADSPEVLSLAQWAWERAQEAAAALAGALAASLWVDVEWRFVASLGGCAVALLAAGVFSAPGRCLAAHHHATALVRKERMRVDMLEKEDARLRDTQSRFGVARAMTRVEPRPVTRDVTRDLARNVTGDKTRDVTRDATRDVTRDATRDVTRDVTRNTTRDMSEDVSLDITPSMTPDMTPGVSSDMTPGMTPGVSPGVTPGVSPGVSCHVTRDEGRRASRGAAAAWGASPARVPLADCSSLLSARAESPPPSPAHSHSPSRRRHRKDASRHRHRRRAPAESCSSLATAALMDAPAFPRPAAAAAPSPAPHAESRGVRRAWPECSHHRHDCIPPTSHNLPALAAAAAAAFAAVSQTNTSVPRGSR